MKRKVKLRELIYLVRYDLMMGFTFNRMKFVVAFFCIIALATMFLIALDAATHYVEEMSSAGFSRGFSPLDVLAYFYAGSDYYQMDDKTPFLLPMEWLIQQVLIAVLVGHYVVQDIESQAPQILTRVRDKGVWWLSKCLWIAATVYAFYALEVVVAIALSAAFGEFGTMEEAESLVVLGFSLSTADASQLALLFLLPLALSLALSFAQVALSMEVGPIPAFALVMAFVVASIYFGSPFLIGDSSMIMRSAFVQPEGVNTAVALVVCTGVSVASVVLGGLAFRRKDLLSKQDEHS